MHPGSDWHRAHQQAEPQTQREDEGLGHDPHYPQLGLPPLRPQLEVDAALLLVELVVLIRRLRRGTAGAWWLRRRDRPPPIEPVEGVFDEGFQGRRGGGPSAAIHAWG